MAQIIMTNKEDGLQYTKKWTDYCFEIEMCNRLPSSKFFIDVRKALY